VDKAHDVQEVTLSGTLLKLRVDGQAYETDLTKHSDRLARANQEQRENFEGLPTGYGIHWPDVDEDLSIDGLIGERHRCPVAETPSVTQSAKQ
jgi:hypothetical protein